MVIANITQGTAWLADWSLFATTGLMVSLAGIIFQGFDNTAPATRTQVNQGIAASGRNVLYYGLPFSAATGFLLWLAMLKTGYAAMALTSLGLDLLLGFLLGVLLFGIQAVIKHYLLRLMLFLEKLTPFNYVRFLGYAARLILLRKVGGGYRFIHRLLLEHFVGRDSPSARD